MKYREFNFDLKSLLISLLCALISLALLISTLLVGIYETNNFFELIMMHEMGLNNGAFYFRIVHFIILIILNSLLIICRKNYRKSLIFIGVGTLISNYFTNSFGIFFTILTFINSMFVLANSMNKELYLFTQWFSFTLLGILFLGIIFLSAILILKDPLSYVNVNLSPQEIEYNQLYLKYVIAVLFSLFYMVKFEITSIPYWGDIKNGQKKYVNDIEDTIVENHEIFATIVGFLIASFVSITFSFFFPIAILIYLLLFVIYAIIRIVTRETSIYTADNVCLLYLDFNLAAGLLTSISVIELVIQYIRDKNTDFLNPIFISYIIALIISLLIHVVFSIFNEKYNYIYQGHYHYTGKIRFVIFSSLALIVFGPLYFIYQFINALCRNSYLFDNILLVYIAIYILIFGGAISVEALGAKKVYDEYHQNENIELKSEIKQVENLLKFK